jgi:DNA invertase Pin-like site-specific DNA recombinase
MPPERQAWCDTTSDVGRFMLAIMAGIAEFERSMSASAAMTGSNVKANGTKFGRPSALDAGERRKIADRYSADETLAELARDYGLGKQRSGAFYSENNFRTGE